MAAAGIGLALGILALDGTDNGIEEWLPWVYQGGADGAREVLAAVAASMLTVLSVTFSVTIVALTVASQQFGPRVLHNFIRKPGPQIVLGSFIGTFLYSLIVLRSVSSESPEFVPHLSVTVGVALAALSIAALIYFIHHVSASIQAANILAEVAAEIDHGIARLFPERLARGEMDPGGPRAPDFELDVLHGEPAAVTPRASGYIQAIDNGRIMKLATACDVVIRLERRPGDFVVDNEILAFAAPARRLEGNDCQHLRDCFLIGPRRTPSQDVTFGLSQLLEIALRALSPASNQAYLANTCVDRLLQVLSHLAERAVPSARRYDDQGKLRVIASPLTFTAAADFVFDALLAPAAENYVTAKRLLEGFGALAPSLRREEDRASVVRHAHLLHREARAAARSEDLKARMDEAYHAAVAALQSASLGRPASS